MSLTELLTSDLKNAMLNRDESTVSVLRMLQSELKNAKIAAMHELSETEMIQVVRKEIKKRRDTANTFKQASRDDRAAQEESEADLLSKYLPVGVSQDTLSSFLKEKASGLAPLEPRHRGELIKLAMSAFPGQVDGKEVAELVNELYTKAE